MRFTRVLGIVAIALTTSLAVAAVVPTPNAGVVKPVTPYTASTKYPGPNAARDNLIPSVVGLTRISRYVPAVAAKPLVPATPATATTPGTPEIPAVPAAPAVYEFDEIWVRADTILSIAPALGHPPGYSIVVLASPPEDPLLATYDRKLLVLGDAGQLAMGWAVTTAAVQTRLTFEDR